MKKLFLSSVLLFPIHSILFLTPVPVQSAVNLEAVSIQNFGADLPVKSVNVSSDRKKVTLQLAGMKSKHVVYIHLNRKTIVSQNCNNLWSTEAWYTMNVLP